MLYQNQIAFNGLILGTEFEEVEEAQKEVKKLGEEDIKRWTGLQG